MFSSLGDIRGSLVSKDIRDIYIGEPTALLGDITGSDGNFLRLQSAFRALTAENELLRARYVQWKEGLPNVHAIEDKDKIITNLTRQIVDLTSQIGSLKSQSSVAVNVSGNTQEYEIKIRTLNSRIQELESQLRTQKVDLEGQIRSKNQIIKDLEDRLASASKDVGDSRVTAQGSGYGSASNVDNRLSSSQASNSSSNSGSIQGSGYQTVNRTQYGTGNVSYGNTATSQYPTPSSYTSPQGYSTGNLTSSGSYGQSAQSGTTTYGATTTQSGAYGGIQASNLSGGLSSSISSSQGRTSGVSGVSYGTSGATTLPAGSYSIGGTSGLTQGTTQGTGYTYSTGISGQTGTLGTGSSTGSRTSYTYQSQSKQ